MNNVLIVLNYNDYKTTSKFLDSIKDYKEINKIVVVDNCSTDNSYYNLQKYENDDIHIIKSERNGGYGYGNNYGIKYAIEKFNPFFITISNPDIKFENKSLKNLKQILLTNHEIAAANVCVRNINGNIEKSSWKLPKFYDDIKEMFLINQIIFKRSNVKNLNSNDSIEINEVLHGCFFMIKSEVIQKIGLYDERTFLFGEERILGYKIKEIGMKQATLNYEECIHEHSKSINKSISSIIDKYNILYTSREVYYKYYIKINKIQLISFKILKKVSLIEKMLLKYKDIFKN